MSSALRSRRWVIAAVVALAAAAVLLLTDGLREEDLPTAVVRRGRLEQSLETTGVVEPAEPVTITGRVSGRIAIVAIRAGDRVDAGDIVAQLDRAPYEVAVEAARRARDAAELALSVAEAGGSASTPAPAEVVAAAQRAADARAALEAAERDLAATAILAPAAGTVLSVEVVEGQGYGPGAPVAVMNAGDRLRVIADLDELDVPRVGPGTPVRLIVDAFPTVELEGAIGRIGPRAEARGGGTIFPATIDVADFRGIAARPGMTVSVRVPTVVVEDALLAPAAAIETVGERSLIRVVRDGRTVPVEVTTGLRSGGLVEIAAGDVGEGERVVVDG